ncbi:MAG: LysR substrate-binding domain-containing protein [Gammaproteobacteria bacterium]|nr:LysR substrate-binding domain-containing protein [Gammaproteobacteria bacterium]
MIKISLRQLEIFCAIARKGQVTKAAETVGLSQSAASMALAELERALGGPLFIREARRLRLNVLGEKTLQHAEALIEQAKKIESLLRNPHHQLTGNLKIGASSTIGNYILPNYLLAFKQKHPQVNIELRVSNTEKIIQDLMNSDLEIGFIEGSCFNHKITRLKWMEDELTIFCRKNHPLTQKTKLNLKDLRDYPWILREYGSGTLEMIDKALSELNFLENPWLRLGSSEAIKQVIQKSDALSILSRSLITQDQTHGVLSILEIPEFKCKRDFYQIQLKNRAGSNLIKHFQAFLKNS